MVIAVFEQKKNRKIIIVFFGIFTFLFAFRKITMSGESDIDAYRFFYDNINNYSLIARYQFEPGYYCVNKIFSIFGLPFEVCMISIGVFFCVLFWKSLSRITSATGICVLASMFLVFYYATGALRQCIAQAIAFYAYYYLINQDVREEHVNVQLIGKGFLKNRVHNISNYYILAMIALLFHRSAIILFLIPFLRKRKFRIALLISALVLSVSFPYIERIILMIPYIAGKYGAYKNTAVANGEITSLFSFRLFEYLIVAGILMLEKNKTSSEKFSLQLVELGIVIQVFLSSYIGASYRFLQFTDFGIVLFTACFFKRINKVHLKMAFLMGVAIIVFLRFYSLLRANDSLNLQYGLVFF
ncbi:MAG: EpsG family protein [Paludibacteraceae bacterium]|nr:EpsG family protein [Paludibacteraceae bacterium]